MQERRQLLPMPTALVLHATNLYSSMQYHTQMLYISITTTFKAVTTGAVYHGLESLAFYVICCTESSVLAKQGECCLQKDEAASKVDAHCFFFGR